MASNIEIKMSGDERDLLRAFQKSNDRMEDMVRGLAKIEQQSNRNQKATKGFTDASSAGLGKVILKFTAMAGGIGAVRKGFDLLIQTNKEFLAEMAQTETAVDKAFRGFRIQASLEQVSGDRAQKKILDSSEELALTGEQGAAIARQAISSGFTLEEATGSAFRAFGEVFQASGAAQRGDDPAQLVQAMSRFLESQGLEKTGANVADVGRRSERLVQGTDFQLSDLSALSKIGPVLKQAGLTIEEQLSAFAVLIGKLPSGESGTGLRNVVSRLGTAVADPAKVKALEGIGLTPEDVDLVGETLPEALERLGEALAKVGPELQKPTLKRIFGEESVAAAQILIEEHGRFEKLGEVQRDQAGFAVELGIATSGPQAVTNRQEIQRQQFILEQAQKQSVRPDEFLTQLAQEDRERGSSPIGTFLNKATFSLLSGLNVSPAAAGSFAFGESSSEAALQALQENKRPATAGSFPSRQDVQDLTAAMKENTQSQREGSTTKVEVEVKSQEGTNARVLRNGQPPAEPPEKLRDARNR